MTHMRSASVMRSGRIARMISSCWKPPRRFQSVGSCSTSGDGCSAHSFQRFHEPSRSDGQVGKLLVLERERDARLPVGVGSHATTGFSLDVVARRLHEQIELRDLEFALLRGRS